MKIYFTTYSLSITGLINYLKKMIFFLSLTLVLSVLLLFSH